MLHIDRIGAPVAFVVIERNGEVARVTFERNSPGLAAMKLFLEQLPRRHAA